MKDLYLTIMLLGLSSTFNAHSTPDQELLEAAQEDNLAGIDSALKKGAHVLAKNDDGQTALMFAAFTGSSAAVRRLLNEAYNKSGSNRGVNFQDATGKTALMYATVNGYKDVISILLAQGADPAIEAINEEGIKTTALSIARANLRDADGQEETAKWLAIIDLLEGKGQGGIIAYPTHIVQPTPTQQPPLNKEELTKQLWHDIYRIGTTQKDQPLLDHITDLLNQGADVNSRDPKSRDTPLIFAARAESSKPLFDLIIERKNVDVNAADQKYGMTALMLCAGQSFGSANGKKLLAKKANVNAQNKALQTALMLFAGYPWMTSADVDFIALLLASDANVNFQDDAHRTALMYLLHNLGRHGSINSAVLGLLLPKSNLQLKNNEGKTALDIAWDMLQTATKHQSVGNLVQAVKLIEKAIEDKDYTAPQTDWVFLRNTLTNHDFDTLLSTNKTILNTANVNIQEPFGKKRTALMRAILLGVDTVINALLALGTQKLNLNLQDADGNPALMYAVYANRNDLVSKLLKTGADKEIKNNEGKTALIIAQDKGYNDIIKTLNPEPSLGKKIMGIFST